VSAIEACPLLLGAAVIISGAVGRTELRASAAGAAAAFPGAVGASAAGAGGIWIAGIAGRLAPPPERAFGAFAPTSIGRVTTTAGAPCPAAARVPDPGDAGDLPGIWFAADEPLFDCGRFAAGIPFCVCFDVAGVPFCGGAFGC
jgi:hypothetical protein